MILMILHDLAAISGSTVKRTLTSISGCLYSNLWHAHATPNAVSTIYRLRIAPMN